MKFALASDIHLEFGPISLENTENADVLVLAGDICVARDIGQRDSYNIRGEHDKSNKIHTFFQECCAHFPDVIYIMGNHEHYHGDFARTLDHLREHFGYLDNLHIMEKEVVTFKEVTFIAGTLFTDMNKEDPQTLHAIKGYMNDYRVIENSNRVVNYKAPIYKKDENGEYITQKIGEINSLIEEGFEFKTRVAKFSPEDTVEDHKEMLKVIDFHTSNVEPGRRFVVVGHHAPSKLSTKPQYENDVMVNGAYSSDLSEFILDRPCIKVWVHGHTHHSFDYMLGTTRIVANPRGYDGYEDQADHFKLQYIEV